MKTKLKNVLCALIVCLISSNSYAQESNEGIKFEENTTFEQAVALAKKENKMLFVDCYTSWCGPCKMMARDVFTQKIVGDYFNPKFVSLKVDMEKGEGVQLRERFNVKAFPTFVILNNKGEILSRFAGGSSAEDFLKRVESSLSEKGLMALQKRYNAGERDIELLKNYINALSEAYMEDECSRVVEELLAGREADLLTDGELYKVFAQHINSPKASSFQYVLANKDAFVQKYGEKMVYPKINNVWMSYPGRFFKIENGVRVFDEAMMQSYIQLMEENHVSNAKEITLLTYINVASSKNDWAEYAKLCSDYQKEFKAVDMYVYNWARNIEKNAKDPKVRSEAASWVEKRLAAIAEKAKDENTDSNNGKNRVSNSATFVKPYEELLSALKQ